MFFNKQVIIKMNNSIICSRPLINNLYPMTALSLLLSNENNHISLKRKQPITNQKHF